MHTLPPVILPPVILLMGPTASGKSALGLVLAEHLGGEIISVDSAQIYRGMDIGTAKPTMQEQTRVPHHLIDILEPEQNWSAAEFVVQARQLIQEVRGRGRVPILLGGTTLYFRALIQGMDAMPEIDPEIRAVLRQRVQTVGAEVLHVELQQVDPAAAARIRPSDPQRIVRALEVFHSSGQPLSSFQTGARQGLPDQGLPEDWHAFALWPEDRAVLRQQIALRFTQMVASGFVAELQGLMARPLLTANHASQRAVGYRQGWDFLLGHCDEATFHQRAIHATRQLAKRQLTWLRSMAGIQRLPTTPEALSLVLHSLRL